MKRSAGLILALVTLALLPGAGSADAPDPWARWRFLLGEWVGLGEGGPGTGTGGSTFALELDGRILVRHNRADYPAAAGRAAFSHRDLLIVYPGTCDSLFHAIYFDNEGHVIQYGVRLPARGGRAVFDSEGPQPGPRFRLTYQLKADGGLETEFSVAPPGAELTRYVAGTLRRAETPPR